MAAVIDKLVVSIIGDTKALKKSLADSKKQLSGFGAAVQKHSAAFMKTGAVMMGFAAAIGIAAVKVGKEFDKAYSKIRTGTGATGKVLEGLKKDFRAVVKDVPNSFDEVSTTIADLNTRLGLTGKPLQDMAKRMLNLARITETDVNAVIRTSTRLFGDWDVAVEDQAETLDYLYKVSQSTGVGIDKLSDMVTTYGVQLRTVGFTMEESLALMGKWEKEGVSAEKMLGGLSMALGKFAKAQKEPEEAFRELVKNIEEATTVGKAMELGVEALGTRAGPDFALAVREGRFAVEDFVEELDGSLETINQAAEDTMTLTEKFDLLKNRAKLAIEPLAKKLMDELAPAIEKVTDWLGDLDEEQLDNIASSVLFATKILAIGGAFIFAMGAVGKFTVAIKTATGWMATFHATALGPWGILAATIASTTLLTGDAIQEVTELTEDQTKALNEAASAVDELIPPHRNLAGAEKDVREAMGELYAIAKEYPQVCDEITDGMFPLIESYKNGEISTEELSIGLNNLVEATKEASKFTWEYTGTIGQSTEANATNAIVLAELKRQLDANEISQGEYDAAVQAATGATEDQTGAFEDDEEAAGNLADEIDNLLSSFNSLVDTIFGGITTYNDFEEANIAVRKAEEELTKAIEEHGIESDEATLAENKLDDAKIKAIKTSFELTKSIDATTEEQEEGRKKAIELGLQYVASGDISIEKFLEMATEYGMSSADILQFAEDTDIDLKKYYKDAADTGIDTFIEMAQGFGFSMDDIIALADEMNIDLKGFFQEVADKSIENFIAMAQSFGLKGIEIMDFADAMGIEIDTATRARLIAVDMDTSEIPGDVAYVNRETAKLKDRDIKITTSYYKHYYSKGYEAWMGAKGGIAGFAGGGITGSDGFSLPILTAAQGLITPSFDSGGILALLHEKEVVLNSGQQLNLAKLIFGLAEGKYGVKGGGGDEYNINIYGAVIKEDMDIRNLALEIEHELLKIKETRI